MSTVTAPSQGYLDPSLFPNRFNVVIPPEAPFYRTGFELVDTDTGRTLIEGLDYYLGYYFKAAAEVYKEAIFGGIILLTAKKVRYTILSVSRDYRIPLSDIGKWLVRNDLKDPRNVDWSAVMQYTPVIAAIDPPTNLEEAVLRDEIVAAINTLADHITARGAELEAALEDVAAHLKTTAEKVFTNGEYQHHLVPNAHTYTATDIGALAVGATAVNAIRAYGRSISELQALMATAGVQTRDIDRLMSVTLGDLYGRLRAVGNNGITFKTANDNHVITVRDGVFSLSTKLAMEFVADKELNGTGVNQIDAGLNSLTIHPGSGVKAPVYNGTFLITPDMVSLYLFGAVKPVTAAYFQSTPTISFTGNGKESSKLALDATAPIGNATVHGLVSITSTTSPLPVPGAVLSQAAVNDIYVRISDYVDDTFTINGVEFGPDHTLELSAYDFGLGNVDNTAPSDKPVTLALLEALELKALTDHPHTVDDVTDIPVPTDTVAGPLRLHDAIDGTVTAALTARQGYLLEKRIELLEDKTDSLLPPSSLVDGYIGSPAQASTPLAVTFTGLELTLVGPIEVLGRGVKTTVSNVKLVAPAADGVYYLVNNPTSASVPWRPQIVADVSAVMIGRRYDTTVFGQLTVAGGVIVAAEANTVNSIGRVHAIDSHRLVENAHGLSRSTEFKRSQLNLVRNGVLDSTVSDTEPVRYVSGVNALAQAGPALTPMANYTDSTAAAPWYSVNNHVESTWAADGNEVYSGPVGWPIASAGVPILHPAVPYEDLYGNEGFGTKFKITNTESKIKIRAWADDALSIYIDGVVMAVKAVFPTASDTTMTFALPPGTHTIAFECTQADGADGSEAWFSFIIYDYDSAADTAVELRRAELTDKVGFTTPLNPDHVMGLVTAVSRVTVTGDVADIVSVTDTATAQPLAHTVTVNATDASKIDIDYVKAYYPFDSLVKHTVGTVSVNVMSAATYG